MVFSFANYILASGSIPANSTALHTSETFAGVFSPGPALSNSARSLTDPVKGTRKILHPSLAATLQGITRNIQLIIGIGLEVLTVILFQRVTHALDNKWDAH